MAEEDFPVSKRASAHDVYMYVYIREVLLFSVF